MNEVVITPTGITNDDTAALQSALDNYNVGQVNLGLGTFALGKRVHRACVRINDRPTPLVIRGADEHGTVLKMVDTDGGSGGDAHMMSFHRCNDLVIENLTLDGNRAAFPDFTQQAHGLYFNGCHHVAIRNVHTKHMIMDGMFFIGMLNGQTEPLCQDFSILNTTHTDNNRSGLAFQRGCKDFLIDGMEVREVSDAAIDTEASGRPAENFVIRNVKVWPINPAYAMSVGGDNDVPCLNFTLENIEIFGGAMSIYHSYNTLLENIVIHGASRAPLHIRGNVDRLTVRGSCFVNASSEDLDAAISIAGYSNVFPGNVTLQGVHVVAQNGKGAVWAENTNYLKLLECILEGTGGGTGAGIRNVSTLTGLHGLELTGGMIKDFNDGIKVRSYSDKPIYKLVSQKVTGENLTRGVWVEGSGYLTHRIVNNDWINVTSPEVYQ